jgi:glycosyltransferase involved in cell wall biosynthesis
MKLCFVADANHANAANWLEYLATDLGHEVHVISCTRVTRQIRGVFLYDLSTPTKYLLLTKIRALQRLFREIKPDLVVAYRVQSYGFLSACTGFHPLVLVAQSRTVVWPPKSRIMAQLCKYAIRRADYILSWAEHTTDRLVQLGADRHQIDTCPRGVRSDLFFPPPEHTDADGHVIITTRSLELDYKQDLIIHAIQDVVRMNERITYRILGRGSERSRLETLVAELGLNSNVEFLGYVPTASLPYRLREASVYVSAYLEDGVSMSLLEAMACGLLPVVPDTEPNRYWVKDGLNGLLFSPGDRVSLAQKLTVAVSDASLRRRARAHNVRLVHDKVNWHKNMRHIEARFSQVIAGASAQSLQSHV